MPRILALCAGLLSATLCHAATPALPSWPQVRQDTEQFTQNRIGDARRLLLGPTAPAHAPLVPQQSCAELYAARLRLMQTQVDYVPPYTQDPRNRAAVFLSTVFTPALFYLAFTGVQAYSAATRGAEVTAKLYALSYASAVQQCYVR